MKVASLLVGLGILAPAGQVINFDNLRPGALPPGWVSITAPSGSSTKWEVVPDRNAPSPPYVLGQAVAESQAEGVPLAILQQPLLRDGEVSVRVKLLSGHADQAGGLVWRYRDPGNYYMVRANARHNNVSVYKIVNGSSVPLVPKGYNARQYAVPRHIPADGWSILKVAFRGNSYSVYVNHRRILQGYDSTFGSSGRVGVWTQSDSVTYFDDFRFVAR